MVQSAINRWKKRNVRAYICPGSDGSSDDRLAVDVENEPKDTRVTYRATLRDCVRTVSLDGATEFYAVLFPPQVKGDTEESPAVVLRSTTTSSELEEQLFIPSLHGDKLATLTQNLKKLIAESTAETDGESYLLCSAVARNSEPGAVLAVVPPKMEADCGFATGGVVLTTR